METGIVPTVTMQDWTGTGVVPFHARIVSADGVPIARHAELYRHVAERGDPPKPVRYRFQKDNTIVDVEVPTMSFERWDWFFTFGLYVLNGLFGLAVTTVVCLLRPNLASSRALLSMGFFWGLFCVSGAVLYDDCPWWLPRLHYLMQSMFGASFIHLGWTFPVERRFIARHRWLVGVPYLVGTAITLWIWGFYYAEPPATLPLYGAYVFSGIAMTTFLVTLAYSLRERRMPLARSQALVVLVGGILGGSVAIYGFIDTALSGGTFPINYIAIPSNLFFLSIAYAIVAHDAFEITRVLRQTVLYYVLILAMVGVYYVGWGAFAALLPGEIVRSGPFTIAFLVLAGMLFQPLRTRVQHMIDGIFYRGRLDYRRTVSRVSAALPSFLSLDQIVDQVGETLHDGFPLEAVGAVLWEGQRTQFWRWNTRAERMLEERPPDLEALRAKLADSRSAPIMLVDVETGVPQPEDLGEIASGIVLAVPIAFRGGLEGVFLLGRKRSGLPFDPDDLALLATLMEQSAVAIQNALSYRVIEDRVRERTADLERSNAELKEALAQLADSRQQLEQSEKLAALGNVVAGVAHEINNPVSFIIGNVKPIRVRILELRERLKVWPDPTSEKTLDLLERSVDLIGRGAERTSKIVRDLRMFSRDGGGIPEPTDLHAALEFNLTLLKDKWDDRITIRRAYGSDVPLIEAITAQLNQVFVNLLANACDAIARRGTISISTVRRDEMVEITIADDGVGIPPAIQARIFEPFFTTKPQGEGVGLGLSISLGIVEKHHGTLEVQSDPGGGSTFCIRLPISAKIH